MSVKCFVDTNILVYARDASEPARQALAMALMQRLWESRSGRTSLQVLSEYYVTVTRKLTPGLAPALAWADVEALLAWDPCPIDRALLEKAHDVETRYAFSWWDSLIVAAAHVCGCDILFTEDLQDGRVVAGVRIVNPFMTKLDDLL